MNFGAGFNKSNMEYYKKMFAKEKRAFILKPKHLRRNRIFAGKPTPQDPRLNPIQKHCKLDDGAGGFIEIAGVPGGHQLANKYFINLKNIYFMKNI